MRLVSVIDSLSGSGGAEHGLVRELTRFGDGWDIEVVRLFAADTLEPTLREAGVRVRAMGYDASSAARIWPLAGHALAKQLREDPPDVVHSSLFTANMVAQMAARRAQLPIVSSLVLSGDVRLLRAHQPGADTWKASVLRSIAGMAARSDRVWFRALTEDTLVTNAELLGFDPARGVVIPRGVPLPDPARDIPSRGGLGLPEGPRLLVNVGRQTAQKGQLVLLDVLERVPDTHVVILGRRGDASDELQAAVTARGLEDRVTLIDFTPRVNDVLAHADVFVFPSLMEGLGTAVLEAMAAGAPVVAFDIPPVAEATDHGTYARLVPVGDVDGFVEQVVATLADGGVADAARGWVEREFSIEVIAGRLQAFLAEVARGRR